MSEIVTIGSALVDMFIRSSHFSLKQSGEGTQLCQRYGEKLEVDSLVVTTGGGGSNNAVGFRRQGFSVSCLAELGKDLFSQVVEADLRAEKVRTEALIRERKEETGGSVILIGPDGGRTVMVHRGAAAQLDESDISASLLKKARWIHLSSISGQLEALQKIFSIARQESIGLSWNPGRAELQLFSHTSWVHLQPAVDIFLVNKEEWESIRSEQPAIIQSVPTVVVTDGSRGGTVYTRAFPHPVMYHSRRVSAVDETGAGDAFGVGFVTAHLRERSLEEACAWGVRNALSVVQQIGAKAGLLTADQIRLD